VGLDSNETIEFNFGQKPFMYNFQETPKPIAVSQIPLPRHVPLPFIQQLLTNATMNFSPAQILQQLLGNEESDSDGDFEVQSNDDEESDSHSDSEVDLDNDMFGEDELLEETTNSGDEQDDLEDNSANQLPDNSAEELDPDTSIFGEEDQDQDQSPSDEDDDSKQR